MVRLNLKADTAELEVLKSYLEENASPTLVEKIENGVKITKDGKTLVNKKDLAGFMKYACEEARKLAGKGATGACVKDEIVFGWLIHYFEEESIEGKLYNHIHPAKFLAVVVVLAFKSKGMQFLNYYILIYGTIVYSVITQ